MNRKIRNLLTMVCICAPFVAFNQILDSLIATADQDTYVDSRYPTSSYENLDTMKSGTNVVTGKFGSNIYYQRVFVQFDISSIPSNAIIYSADLLLTRANGITANFDWKAKLVETEWSENITLNTQPTISNLTDNVSTVAATTNSVQTIDVKDMVQRMVYGAADNYGWSVQVDDENYSGYSGTWFYTSEYSSNDDRPKLKVKYYIPLAVSNVDITHESGVSTQDAVISYSLTNGCSSTYTYKWINSSGTQISTNDSLINVSYGWYGLEVTGVQCGEKMYQGFLVGRECDEVTITYDATPNYTQNVYVWDRTQGGIDYSDWNWSNMYYFRTDNKDHDTYWSDIKSYIEFNTWMDADFEVNQADILFEGWTHVGNGSSNPAEFVEVTESWNEDVITWNSTPTDGGTAGASIPSTTSSTSDMTVDMTTFWDDWKLDNSTNHGVVFQLEDFDDDVDTRHVYHSPNTSTTSLRPEWTFELSLVRSNNPIFCGGAEDHPYNELKKQLDGGYGESYDDTLNFALNEAYGVDTLQYLEMTIYDDDHEVLATCNASGTTTGGAPALIHLFDDNRYVMNLSGITALVNGQFYVLEVKNAKEDRFYLKFKHNE